MAKPLRFRSTLAAAILVASICVPPGISQTCTPGTRGALSFDGVDDYVRIPNHSAFNNLASFTFELWFKANPTGPTFRALLDHGGGNPFLFGVFTKITIFLDGLQVMQPGPPILDGLWHHFALTGSGSAVKFYLDGNLIAQGTYPNPLNGSTDDFYIGAGYGGGPFYDHWSGAIDEVRIWSVARTAAEIAQNRLYTLTGAELGLVAYYRFDAPGQTVSNLAVSTGSTLDGTLGPDANATSQDPTFTTTDFTPMFYCVSGPGQANSNEARLQVNGAGAGTAAGPFNVTVIGGNTVTFAWNGPASAPFALAAGYLNTNNLWFGCTGHVDLGTPPFYQDIHVFLDGLSAPGNMFYVLSSGGSASQTYTVPQAAVGLSATFQGLVVQPPGSACPVVLTAAFTVSIT